MKLAMLCILTIIKCVLVLVETAFSPDTAQDLMNKTVEEIQYALFIKKITPKPYLT